ncbi:DUF1700 domain-containing protein [Undibacterium sp. Ren11W]|uniref:DUF1700 domain-containing protein n=1 Tax=Undibacterium sp. Ren11W TaxID=3413045 RepID=UPI003BF01F73
MNKTEYMNMLKQELSGLPSEVIEDTLWSYEAKFVDAMVAGRDENEIVASLPKPHLIAAQKRSALRYQALKENVRPSNLASLLVALLGVLVFNFLLLLPAIIYSSLLFSAYIGSLVMYVAGIAITAASLSGAPQINFDIATPRHFALSGELTEGDTQHRSGVLVDISPAGIVVDDLNLETDLGKLNIAAGNRDEDSILHVGIGNHLNQAQLLPGIGWLLGGICLWMLCLLMTKYSFIGFKNYLRWNISLLQLPRAV